MSIVHLNLNTNIIYLFKTIKTTVNFLQFNLFISHCFEVIVYVTIIMSCGRDIPDIQMHLYGLPKVGWYVARPNDCSQLLNCILINEFEHYFR